jgi:ABC-type Fe3+ transport system permease subunit
LEYFMAIWYILWPFGNFVIIWYIVSPFWYIVTRKIWQPWSRGGGTLAGAYTQSRFDKSLEKTLGLSVQSSPH